MTVVNPKSISGINSITMASGSDNLLTIHTTNTTERLRINSSGDVIVGSGITVSPDGDIFATGITTVGTGLSMADNVPASFGDSGDLKISHNGSDSLLQDSGTGNLKLISNGSGIILEKSNAEPMVRAYTDGAVELFHDNSKKLETTSDGAAVSGALGVGGAVNLTDTSTGTGTNGGIYRHSNGYTYYQPKSDGNGGILSNGDGTATWRTHSPGGSDGYLTAEVGDGTQRLLLDQNGYLGLHITDPHLYYSKTLVVGAETEGDGGGITIKGSSSHTNYLMFADSNSGAARYDGYIGYSHNAQELYLAAAGASRAKISSNGNLTIGNGNIIIGTAGKGIDFSATTDATGTMSSELFDDYEEGSWTPVYEGTTTTGTVSYAAQIGKYVKIGKVVFWEFYMNFNNGNGAGLVHISGLPFTTASNSTYPAVNIGYVHNHTLRSDHILTGLHANSSNYLYFYERPNGGGTNVQLNYDGSGSLIMSGHYQAG